MSLPEFPGKKVDPTAIIQAANELAAAFGSEQAAARVPYLVHVPMTEADQQPPVETGLFTAFKPGATDAPCDLPDPLYNSGHYAPRHRMTIDNACGDGDGIRVAEMNESGPAVPGNNFTVSPDTLARIVRLYRGEDPNAPA